MAEIEVIIDESSSVVSALNTDFRAMIINEDTELEYTTRSVGNHHFLQFTPTSCSANSSLRFVPSRIDTFVSVCTSQGCSNASFLVYQPHYMNP